MEGSVGLKVRERPDRWLVRELALVSCSVISYRKMSAAQDTYVDMASFGPVLEQAFAATGILPRNATAS